MQDEDRIRGRVKKLEQGTAEQERMFRDKHCPEEAQRIKLQVKELKEQLLEFHSRVNLESYIRYFYENTVTLPKLLHTMGKTAFFMDEPARIKEQADAVELEFRESMTQRMEKGYLLPGQKDIL